MQGCRTEEYEGCECKDARLKDTKDRGCSLVNILRSLVAPLRGAGGYIYIYTHIWCVEVPDVSGTIVDYFRQFGLNTIRPDL